MNSFNVDTNFVPGFSCLQWLQASPLLPAEASGLRLVESGRLVQPLASFHSRQSGHQAINQDAGHLSRSLSDFSVSLLPPVANKLAPSGWTSRECLDGILPAADSALTDLTKASPQRIAQILSPPGYLSVDFSQPSLHPAATTGLLTEYTRQQVDTEAVRSEPTVSPSFKSLIITPREAYRRAYQRAYNKAYRSVCSEPCQAGVALSGGRNKARQAGRVAGRAEMRRLKNSCDSGLDKSLIATAGELCDRAYDSAYRTAYRRACRAEMALSSDEDKARQAGRVAGRAAGRAERERVKASFASTISPEEACCRAYHRAYQRAHRAEMFLSGDKYKARQAGRAAGEAERERVEKATAQRSLADSGKTPQQPANSLAEKAEKEDLPVKNGQLLKKTPAPGSGESPTLSPTKAYGRAYSKAYRAEMALSGDKNKASQAGRSAGEAEKERVKSLLFSTLVISWPPLVGDGIGVCQ